MAYAIEQAPADVTPAFNPVVYVVSSSNYNQPNPQELYARNYTLEEVDFRQRSTTGLSGQILNEAGDAFNKKDFKKCNLQLYTSKEFIANLG